MSYGLTDIELQRLCSVFAKYSVIERAILYGSRAKGNYKPFSDVDITLVGDDLTHADLVAIASDIDNLLLPYQCDLSLFKTLKNEALIEHIKRVGVRLK